MDVAPGLVQLDGEVAAPCPQADLSPRERGEGGPPGSGAEHAERPVHRREPTTGARGGWPIACRGGGRRRRRPVASTPGSSSPSRPSRPPRAGWARCSTSPDRAALVRSMAAHVLAAAAPLPVCVACDDPEVAAFAESHGASVSWTPGLGLNGAVEAGVAHLAWFGATYVTVVHADLPLAVAIGSLEHVDGVTIAPDRRDAAPTCCACRPAPPSRCGSGTTRSESTSTSAIGAGLAAVVLDREDLAFDVDVPGDLTELETRDGGPRRVPPSHIRPSKAAKRSVALGLLRSHPATRSSCEPPSCGPAPCGPWSCAPSSCERPSSLRDRRLAAFLAGALRAVVLRAVVLRAAVFFAGRRFATFLAAVLRVDLTPSSRSSSERSSCERRPSWPLPSSWPNLLDHPLSGRLPGRGLLGRGLLCGYRHSVLLGFLLPQGGACGTPKTDGVRVPHRCTIFS